ncbi:hypothetical protein ACJMK2_029515 [Sinanodonta woodiana]|uniref:Uncharacterized protein n=1 Tax=Sinanodonta woodiana TaxID=1069815 RepID=A0ABD3XAY3_SINWO
MNSQLRHLPSSQSELPQPSVIMRMSSSNQSFSSTATNNLNFDRDDTNRYSQSKSPKIQTQVQGTINKLPISNPNTNGSSDLLHEDRAMESTQKLYEMKSLPSRGLHYSDDALMECLRSGCAYDSYSQSNSPYPSTHIPSTRTYPGVPQAGYTSVIVDTQQYHMANGYVH